MLAASPSIIRTPSHQYLAGERELLAVTRVLELAAVTDWSAPWYSTWHRDRGRLVHETIALENEGALNDETLDAQLAGYLEGYRRFRAEVGGELEWHEQIVSDIDLGVAGTLDLIIRHSSDHPRRRRLYDIKPSAAPPTAIQLAAYARMAHALYGDPMVFARAALILPGDGTYRLEPYDDPNDERVFLAALRVAHWKVAHGRR